MGPGKPSIKGKTEGTLVGLKVIDPGRARKAGRFLMLDPRRAGKEESLIESQRTERELF
jgi:hypothetical protein